MNFVLIESYNYLFLDFKCSTNADCHGKGFCDESATCQCSVNWDSKEDCSGKFLLCLQNIQKVFEIYLFLEFKCHINSDCNGKGTCTDNTCHCIPGWNSETDCTSECLVKLLGQMTTAIDSIFI